MLPSVHLGKCLWNETRLCVFPESEGGTVRTVVQMCINEFPQVLVGVWFGNHAFQRAFSSAVSLLGNGAAAERWWLDRQWAAGPLDTQEKFGFFFLCGGKEHKNARILFWFASMTEYVFVIQCRVVRRLGASPDPKMNCKIPEWSGQGGTFRTLHFHLPATGRDTFH